MQRDSALESGRSFDASLEDRLTLLPEEEMMLDCERRGVRSVLLEALHAAMLSGHEKRRDTEQALLETWSINSDLPYQTSQQIFRTLQSCCARLHEVGRVSMQPRAIGKRKADVANPRPNRVIGFERTRTMYSHPGPHFLYSTSIFSGCSRCRSFKDCTRL